MIDEETVFLKKLSEQLKGYCCGKHKRLEKTIFNRMKKLK